MRCRFCGRDLNENSSFCPYCGNDIKKDDNNMFDSNKINDNEGLSKEEIVSLVISGLCMILSLMTFSKLLLFVSGGIALLNIIYINFINKQKANKYKTLITVISAFAFLTAFVLVLYIQMLN